MEIWISSIIAIAIGAILNHFGEYFLGLIIYLFGKMEVRKLPKRWKTKWSYSDEDENEEGNDIIEIKQIGPFISGHAKADIHNYIVKARLHSDGTIQGTWKTHFTGKFWYGTFHLHVDLDAQTMRGKWIGKLGKAPGKVRGGDWTWEALKQ